MELTIDQALQKAVEAHKAGQIKEADRLYTAILKAQPKHPDANHNLGVLAVGVGKVQEALPFFKIALEANPSIAQFWLSYINALIKLDRKADAKAILDQAKNKGATGNGFDQLEKRLNQSEQEHTTGNRVVAQTQSERTKILNTLNPDQAISLGNKKEDDGSNGSTANVQDPPHEQLQTLINLYNQGLLQQALEHTKSLVREYSTSPILFNVQGAIFKQLGQLDLCIKSYTKAVEIKPDYAEALNGLGVALKDQGRLEEALIAYKKALSLKPDYAEAINNMGYIHLLLGRNHDAEHHLKNSLKLKPNLCAAHKNLAHALKRQNKLNEAIDILEALLKYQPDDPDIYNEIGVILKSQEKIDAAILCFHEALRNNKNYVDAFNNLGLALAAQGKYAEAIEHYDMALSIEPNHPDIHNNKGIVLKSLGKLQEAIVSYESSLDLKPDHADAHYNLGIALLNLGDVARGLDHYEWRWKKPSSKNSYREFPFPQWKGDVKLADKNILIWNEQGLGETLNWSSRLPLIKAGAGQCTLECEAKLVSLLSRSFPDVKVRASTTRSNYEIGNFDYHLPIGSLFRETLKSNSNIFPPKPHLIPDSGRVAHWIDRLNKISNRPKVGICWKSSVRSINRMHNYASVEDWAPVLQMQDVTWINLQYRNFSDDLLRFKDEFGIEIVNFEDLDLFNDIDDVAALCTALDLVVSTTCAVPFISAGVGTRTILLSWKQSPWNNILFHPKGPEVVIYQRNTWDDWQNLFKDVEKAIGNTLFNIM